MVMTKAEVLTEIDKKIEICKKRIATRENQPCYFDQTKRIQQFIERISELEEVKEWINKID